MIYDNLQYNKNIIRKIKPSISCHFVDGAYVEISNGEPNKDYKVQMIFDDHIHYESFLSKGMWARSGIKYFRNWVINVYDGDELVYNHVFNPTGQRVFISLESQSLGDTLAWFPFIDEFRKKHNCKTIACTFLNEILQEQYPEIEFVKPGEVVNNLYAMYRIGWFYDGSEWKRSNHKSDFKTISLQQASSDILGLEPTEVKAKLKLNNNKVSKKVGIGIHATCQSKYWNNPDGWQQVVNYLNQLGYKVVLYSKEQDGHMGNKHPKGITKFVGASLQEVIEDLSTCEFFIGLGSGLSWLAWSCNLPVVLISGFSEPYSETISDTYRVFNDTVCNGCFNKYKLDASDWNWCPVHKGTDRQFECTKQISHLDVISKVDELIKRISA